VRALATWSLLLSACAGFAVEDELAIEEPEAPASPPVRAIPDAKRDEPPRDDDAEPVASPPRTPRGVPAPGVPADARITLERTACYGRCPIYTVTLFADGEVQWHGTRFVEVRGDESRSITPEAFAKLWRDLTAHDYADLPTEYPNFGSGYCTSYATDQPSAIVAVSGDGAERRVVDYHGCRNAALQEFRPFEDRIDRVAGSKRWVGRCAESPCHQ
jgi:hypothetical protein